MCGDVRTNEDARWSNLVRRQEVVIDIHIWRLPRSSLWRVGIMDGVGLTRLDGLHPFETLLKPGRRLEHGIRLLPAALALLTAAVVVAGAFSYRGRLGRRQWFVFGNRIATIPVIAFLVLVFPAPSSLRFSQLAFSVLTLHIAVKFREGGGGGLFWADLRRKA